jgi:hypothetical protein
MMSVIQNVEFSTQQDRATVPEAVTWVQADRGFWVGSALGEFVGTIERQGGVYAARGARGQSEGTHPTLASARHHLASCL